ncbi:MAG: putative membrane protein insertion efficiency factor [Chlamydiae bacterium]|nr:putative membrane protein insertion efficiency factor [Chlamydiota bacterium]
MVFTFQCTLIKRLFILLILFYQKAISPLLGDCCRFHPSCSEYCKEAIEKHGSLKGIWLGLRRIVKCGPWSKGGVDQVP